MPCLVAQHRSHIVLPDRILCAQPRTSAPGRVRRRNAPPGPSGTAFACWGPPCPIGTRDGKQAFRTPELPRHRSRLAVEQSVSACSFRSSIRSNRYTGSHPSQYPSRSGPGPHGEQRKHILCNSGQAEALTRMGPACAGRPGAVWDGMVWRSGHHTGLSKSVRPYRQTSCCSTQHVCHERRSTVPQAVVRNVRQISFWSLGCAANPSNYVLIRTWNSRPKAR